MKYKPEDLRIDSFHACEHSGFVHTNHTAVRITHLPTGAYVESKDERSLHMNKQRCMELLPDAVEARLGTRSISRAEELIADLEAEIVKRDARIAELEQQRGVVVLPDQDRCFELADAAFPGDVPQELAFRVAMLTGSLINEVARLNQRGECVAVDDE